MTEQAWFNAISSLLSILGLCVLAFWLFRSSMVDRFRQRMFILRDNLFDEAADGLVSFDHPAYGLLRGMMNSCIRNAHRPFFWSIVLLLINRRADAIEGVDGFASEYERATQDLPSDTRQKLDRYKSRMGNELLFYIVFGQVESIAFLAIAVIALVIYVAWRILCAAMAKTTRTVRQEFEERKRDIEETGYQIAH